jgi:hypothetical protein
MFRACDVSDDAIGAALDRKNKYVRGSRSQMAQTLERLCAREEGLLGK